MSDVCLDGPFESIEINEDFDREMLPVFDKEEEKSPERSEATVLTSFPSLKWVFKKLLTDLFLYLDP